MAAVVSRWFVTTETLLPSLGSQCEICGGQIGTGRGFSPRVLRF
jgi:hypothetical protein